MRMALGQIHTGNKAPENMRIEEITNEIHQLAR